MNFQRAKEITKEYRRNNMIHTPQLSDDWTLDFETEFYNPDRVIFKSEKLDTWISLKMQVKTFFSNYIFTKKINIDGSRLIGEFALSNTEIHLKDEFEEALKTIQDLDNKIIISNDELIEYGLYLDENGIECVYLGHISFNVISNDFSVKKDKGRYIVPFHINESSKITLKTNQRKFIKFIRQITLEEKTKLFYKILHTINYSYLVFLIKNSNSIIIDEYNLPIYTNKCFAKKDDKFYFIYTRSGQSWDVSDIDIKRYKH